MSLIPFILDLADELHEFSRCLASGIDINDFGFGLYTGSDLLQSQPSGQQQQQQATSQQQSPRRSRTSSFSSSFWMPSKRHHPYNRIKSACCGKSLGDEGAAVTVGLSGAAGGDKDVSPTGTPGKTASYSVVNKNGFQVSMNVKQFAPNELSVKTIDNCIVVEGRHDDKEDGHGVISRHFVRKYMLPKGYDPKDVLSTLSSDGILTVKAPPPPPPIAKNDERNERIVEIQPAPGPAQTVPVVVSAKETPVKEQAKKVLSPAARVECQLPEKRQKLDLPQQQEQETTEGQTPPSPQPEPLPSPTPQTLSSPTTATAAAAADGNEKKEEQTAENNDKQPDNVAVDDTPAAEDDVDMESKSTADQVDDKQLEPKEAMEIDETDKTTVEEKQLPETNGDTSVVATENSPEADEPVTESCTNSAPTKTSDDEVPAVESANDDEGKASKDDDSKMEVDEVTDSKAEAEVTEYENNEKAENEKKEGEGKAKATDNITNNAITTTNNCTPAKKADNEKKDEHKTTASEKPADKANSVATTKPAESATNDGDNDTATAVLPPEAKNDIDDVALLKAAVTADAAEITAAEENALLSEPVDDLASTESSSAVDKVECSLFAKTHLGNGNSNSATLVATEEVAN